MTRSDLNLNNLSLAAVAGIPQQFVCDGASPSRFFRTLQRRKKLAY